MKACIQSKTVQGREVGSRGIQDMPNVQHSPADHERRCCQSSQYKYLHKDFNRFTLQCKSWSTLHVSGDKKWRIKTGARGGDGGYR